LFNEDTVINDIPYHKLFHTNDSAITKENSTCIGGIREDSFKRVWYYNFSFPYEEWKPPILFVQDEIKLYDFSVSIGDTLRDLNFLLEYWYLVVKDIDTIQVNNTLRKVYSFDPINWVYWVEGIGNTKGLLFTSGDLPTDGMNSDLICFHQNNTLLYHYSGNDNIYDGCVPSFVLNDVSILPNPEVKVYPNPATNELVYFEGLDFEKLELFDNKGNLIFSENISGLNKYALNICRFAPGVYFYQLKKQGLLSTGGKLIIP
jgi:hypothetical protein